MDGLIKLLAGSCIYMYRQSPWLARLPLILHARHQSLNLSSIESRLWGSWLFSFSRTQILRSNDTIFIYHGFAT
ncbi:hypothetical protein DAI22_08g231200 [Oryza sativa Japonica Group]|nr:hypothetical protein DAI22_08g231200 [Oryza sativa Japonica Group]